jgi:tetratricopeptide (TPR) repeat protein
MSLAVGTILAGRYRILARLGEGGMGSVYQAEDLLRPGLMWAIKELLRDATTPADEWEAAVKRFDAEIRLMASLSNPRIPRVVDSFTEGLRRFFVMDFIPGQSLEQRLEQAQAPLPEQQVLDWAIQVCDVLSYVHTHRPPIILRDLKPGNIMITPAGEVRVIDLGIARTYKLGKQSNTENLGTLIYASPEHLGQSAQTDTRSDIYSLGATLYHVLTNHEPTPMETPIPGSLRRLNRSLSEQTEAIVIRAMRINPAERFQTAADMANALRASLTRLQASGGVAAPVRSTVTAQRTASSPSARRAAALSVPVAGVPSTAPHLSSVRGGVVCPQCGHLNRTGARFCSRDGMPLPGAAPAVLRGMVPPHATPAGSANAASHSPRGAQSGAARQVAGTASPLPSAAPVLRRRTAATPPTADVQQQRALDAFSSGRYQQAARLLEAAIASGRDTYDVHLLLARAYRHLDRPAQAITQYERASRLRPNGEIFCELGMAEREAGRIAEAQAAFTRARQLSPRDATIAYQLGITCLDLGHLAQAEGELEAGLTLQPEHLATLLALGKVQAQRQRWDEAVTLFRRATAADPDSSEAHLALGRSLMSEHRWSEAVPSLDQAARLAPDSVDAQLALGMCYHALDKRRQAKRALERVARLDPLNTEARRLLDQL